MTPPVDVHQPQAQAANNNNLPNPADITLGITPFDTYMPAREVPQKCVGVEAALKAAEDSSFEPQPTIFKEFALDGRVAVVTGGNGGIGLEYAITLAEQGAIVYCLDLADSPSQEFLAVKSYIKRMPNSSASVEYRKANVTDSDEMRQVVGEIATTHNRLDICVANAGILGPIKDCHEYPVDWFRKVIDVNVTGVFLTIQSCVREMLIRNIKGSVVATASMSGSIINKDMHWVPYTTSKAAVIQMVKAFATELGCKDIRVNSISPGHIRTRMTEVYLGSQPMLENQWAAQNPMGRLGGVHELRGVLAYLASDASSYTTGQDFPVCGGHVAW